MIIEPREKGREGLTVVEGLFLRLRGGEEMGVSKGVGGLRRAPGTYLHHTIVYRPSDQKPLESKAPNRQGREA